MNLDLMSTEERRELLNAYLDGELSADEALEVSTWLDANAGALREVEHLRHLWDLLEHYEDEPVAEDFAPGVMRAVGIEREQRGGKVIPMAWYRRPLATAAAVLVAVGATVFVMSNQEGGTVVPRTEVAKQASPPQNDVVLLLESIPADQLQDVLLNGDVLLSIDDAALEAEYDEESVLGG